MNKKGFTLVEFLGVIVIMAIVLVIAIPSSIEAYKKSRLKTEETFVKRLSEVVDIYTSLNTDNLRFNTNIGSKIKRDKENREVTVFQVIKPVQDLIDQNLISSKDYINPNNKNIECSTSAEIEIYKDSDFVYCHKIRAETLACLTDDFIEYKEEKLKEENENYPLNGNPYVVDTCVWSDN